MSQGYEFTGEQNDLIGRLSRKMSLVGTVSVVFGVLYLISAVLLLVFIFQDKVPADVFQKIPEDVRSRVPGNTYLWGVVVQAGLAALIFLLIGSWTRSAAAGFGEIVTTSGRDISHLMAALSSLYKMYSLMYTLIVVTVVALLVGLALQLYLRSGG
ncbi:MAG: hypothetical protein K2X87_23415 [Gemmataceae bacterium]|nr:hypothetical protein [Gemmataceae bacterium]